MCFTFHDVNGDVAEIMDDKMLFLKVQILKNRPIVQIFVFKRKKKVNDNL